MAVSLTGSWTFIETGTEDGSQGSISIPADAELAIVVVTGFVANSTEIMKSLSLEADNQDDFTLIIEGEEGIHHQSAAYYSTDFTADSTATLYWELNSSANEGVTIGLGFYKGVDTSDPIGDSQNSGGWLTTWTSSLTGVGANDMGVLLAYDYQHAPDVDYGGQTKHRESLYNYAGFSLAEEQGEDELKSTAEEYMLSIAFAINASDDGTTLTVNDASHSHSLDTVGLTQRHNISVTNLQHSQSLATVSLTQRSDLSVAELKHTHAIDGVTVTQRHVLSLEDLQHVHTLDDTALTQLHNLSPADLQHAQSLDGVALSVAGVTTLILEDLLHGQAIDSVGLQQIGNITVADLLHTHSVDGISLAGRTTITVADLAHTHALDGDNTLVQAHVLVVDDLGHAHSVGTVSLQQINLLVLQDLLHAHTLDRVSFSLAQGIVTITFSSEQPSVVFSSEQPSVDWSN